MAKHETTDPVKKEKKDKKRKSDAVDDAAKAEKKKEKKARKSLDASAAGVDVSMADAEIVKNGDGEEKATVVKADGSLAAPLAALVPFAHPLCDEKSQKKVLKGVKKGMLAPSSRFSHELAIAIFARAPASLIPPVPRHWPLPYNGVHPLSQTPTV